MITYEFLEHESRRRGDDLRWHARYDALVRAAEQTRDGRRWAAQTTSAEQDTKTLVWGTLRDSGSRRGVRSLLSLLNGLLGWAVMVLRRSTGGSIARRDDLRDPDRHLLHERS